MAADDLKTAIDDPAAWSAGELNRRVREARDPADQAGLIPSLEKAAESEPLATLAHCWRGRLLEGLGDAAAARAAYESGGAGLDRTGLRPPAWAVERLADLLTASGDAAAAAALLRRFVDDPASGPQPRAVGLLGLALLKGDPQAADLEARIEAAILATPHNRELVASWIDWLTVRSSPDAVTAKLRALQLRSPQPLRAVMKALRPAMGEAEFTAAFAPQIEAWRQATPFVEIGRAWACVSEGREAEPQDRAIVSKRRAEVDVYFEFVAPPLRQIPFHDGAGSAASDAFDAKLRGHGVVVEPLRERLRELRSFRNQAWADLLEQSAFDDDARLYCTAGERSSAWLDHLTADLGLPFPDPMTGEPIAASDSLIINGRTIYAYRGRHSFFLITGGTRTALRAVYIPALDLGISLHPVLDPLLEPGTLATLLATLLRRACDPPKPREDRPSGLTLFIHPTDNFAHQLWNFFCSLERALVGGFSHNIRVVEFSGTEFFGPLERLFPEFADRIVRPARTSLCDPAPYRGDHLAMPSGGGFIPRRLVRRLIDAARSLPRASPRHLEPADFPRAADAPVIWIGMRLNDKSWVDQEAGIIDVVAAVSRRHPDAFFLLDGFSFPIGEDLCSSRWRSVIEKLDGIATRIQRAAPDPARVVNMVGNTFRESLLWAEATDIYLAPYGSTQHKIGWFTDAPGIVYAPPIIDPATAAISPACVASEIGARPTFIFADAVSQGERRGPDRSRESFENVALDAGLTADLILSGLNDRLRASRRPSEAIDV